jgi:hypothetical protein
VKEYDYDRLNLMTDILKEAIKKQDDEVMEVTTFFIRQYTGETREEKRDELFRSWKMFLCGPLNSGHHYYIPRRSPDLLKQVIDLEIVPLAQAAAVLEYDIMGEFLVGHKKAGSKKLSRDEWIDMKGKMIYLKLRHLIRSGLYQLDRNEKGKLVLIDIRGEEE